MMSVESPISVGLISRLPNAEVHTAAFLVLMGLALWIESPVIDLLATSTTLASSPENTRRLTRFALVLIAWVTVAHAAVALTPLYGLVTLSILRLPPEVAEAGRVAFAIMIPWSGLIGWRRFLQGMMIRRHETRLIGVGTMIRVSTMFGTGTLLFLTGRHSYLGEHSVELVAISLIASVASEALFIHFAGRRAFRSALATPIPKHSPSLNLRRLAKFHFPLTITTMVNLTAIPIVSAALAYSPDAVLALAGWQVALALLSPLRTVVFALPEVVITLMREEGAYRRLQRFCLGVGLTMTGIGFGFAALGLDRRYFIDVLGTSPAVADVAHVAVLAGAAMPILSAMQCFLRGVLTFRHVTVARLTAVVVGIVVLIGALIVGVMLRSPGAVLAPLAVMASLGAEYVALVLMARRNEGDGGAERIRTAE